MGASIRGGLAQDQVAQKSKRAIFVLQRVTHSNPEVSYQCKVGHTSRASHPEALLGGLLLPKALDLLGSDGGRIQPHCPPALLTVPVLLWWHEWSERRRECALWVTQSAGSETTGASVCMKDGAEEEHEDDRMMNDA